MMKPCQDEKIIMRRKLRFLKFIGLRELARRTGIDCGHLSRWERGLAGMGSEKLRRLARVLEVPIEILEKNKDDQ